MICLLNISFYTEKVELRYQWCNFLPLSNVVSSIKTVDFNAKRFYKVLTITIIHLGLTAYDIGFCSALVSVFRLNL